MPMDPGEIERLIKESLPDAEVRIQDLAGDGDHYAAHVKSAAFKGKTRVQQHQMVYQALQGRMQTGAPSGGNWRFPGAGRDGTEGNSRRSGAQKPP